MGKTLIDAVALINNSRERTNPSFELYIVHINSVMPIDNVLSAVIAQIGIEKVHL